MKTSIRELMMLVGAAALWLASIHEGGVFAAVALILGSVVLIRTAFILMHQCDRNGRGSRCFLAVVIAYVGIHAVWGVKELEPHLGRLPTSRILTRMHADLVTRWYINSKTGTLIPLFNVDNSRVSAFDMQNAKQMERPTRLVYMLLGHMAFALLLGWIASKLALGRRPGHAKPNLAGSTNKSAKLYRLLPC